jgi:hypothetical protein
VVFVDDVDAVAPVRGSDSTSERSMDRCPLHQRERMHAACSMYAWTCTRSMQHVCMDMYTGV